MNVINLTNQSTLTITRSIVFCSLVVDGIHRWEDCPIEEVKFLRDDHRHMFHIKAYKGVSHSDRDVEFIWLKHEITEYLRLRFWDNQKRSHYFGKRSCEMIAEELIKRFDLCKCEVNEDGESGAIVEVVNVAN